MCSESQATWDMLGRWKEKGPIEVQEGNIQANTKPEDNLDQL